MRLHQIGAIAALALTTGVIGFGIGRGTVRSPGPRAGDEVPRRAVVGDSTLPFRADLSRSDTGEPAGRPTGASAARLASSPAVADAAAPAKSGATASIVDDSPAPAPARSRTTRDGRRRVMLGDLDLTGIGYDRGSPEAPLVLIDFSDFGCPYCGEFARETYPEIDRDYIQTGKVYFKYVPFLAGFANGREATRAAECAADQGKFWEMADAVYASQDAWQKARDPHAELRKVADTAGLDTAAYWACYAVHRPDGRTRRATDAAEKVQVRVTPSFVLNGRPIEGALPLAEFRKLLDASLLLEESRR